MGGVIVQERILPPAFRFDIRRDEISEFDFDVLLHALADENFLLRLHRLIYRTSGVTQKELFDASPVLSGNSAVSIEEEGIRLPRRDKLTNS